jgi:hypothetical protein
MNTCVHLLHNAQLVLEWEMFLTKVVTYKTKHNLESKICFNNHSKVV